MRSGAELTDRCSLLAFFSRSRLSVVSVFGAEARLPHPRETALRFVNSLLNGEVATEPVYSGVGVVIVVLH